LIQRQPLGDASGADALREFDEIHVAELTRIQYHVATLMSRRRIGRYVRKELSSARRAERRFQVLRINSEAKKPGTVSWLHGFRINFPFPAHS
jgi:hypothetical protein